jgi:apolipoprotein N-acyltransferase
MSYYLTSAVLGLLCGLAYSVPSIGPFGLMGYAVLLAILPQLDLRAALRGMAVFGFCLALCSTYWLWRIFGPMALILWGYIGLTLSLFGVAFALIHRTGWAAWVKVMTSGMAWTAIDYLRGEVLPLSFPWLQVSLLVEPAWPLLSWIGCYGVSGVVVMALFAGVRRQLILFSVIIVLIIGLQLLNTKQNAPAISVCCVQSESHDVSLLQSMSTQGTQLVIWPELAAPIAEQAVLPDERLLVTGTSVTKGRDWENSAFTTHRGAVLGQHVKNHTVHFFNDGRRGQTRLPFETPLGRIGTPICFDCDHQDVVRAMTSAGAECFAVPSLDPAYWGETQHRMHAQVFRLRAAENHRWLAVASGSGLTQIINPQGRVVAALPLMEPGTLMGKIERLQGVTVFTRFGWLWAPSCLGLLVLLVARQGLRSSKEGRFPTGLGA